MNCQAKINDHYGNKFKCGDEATKKIIIETFAPHLQKTVTKIRCLCSNHAKRLRNRHNYQIKNMGKKTILTQTEINPA